MTAKEIRDTIDRLLQACRDFNDTEGAKACAEIISNGLSQVKLKLDERRDLNSIGTPSGSVLPAEMHRDTPAPMQTAETSSLMVTLQEELSQKKRELDILRRDYYEQKNELENIVEENIKFQDDIERKDSEISELRNHSSDAEIILQNKLNRYEQEFNQKNHEIAELREDIKDKDYILLQKDCALDEADLRLARAVKEVEEERDIIKEECSQIKQERDQLVHSLQNMKAERKQQQQEQALKITKYEDMFRFCTGETKEYARKCLNVITLANRALDYLDDVISDFYQDDDDANYFYVRRRMKFFEATGNLEALKKYSMDLHLIANHGVIFETSSLSSSLERDAGKETESFKYFIYTMLMRDTIGPTIILLREMINMSRYVGIGEIRNMEAILGMHEELMSLTAELGYRVVDVELFAPMPLSDEIECTDIADIDIEGLESGCIYEIAKLAVLYGTYSTTTEVKIKR